MDGADHLGKSVRSTSSAVVILVILSSALAPLAAAQEPSSEIVAPAARNVTPSGITPGPTGEGPLIREPVPPPPPEPPRWRRFFLPKTADAATFKVADRTIRIVGVKAPAPDATCRRANGESWPCGRTALYSLRTLLRGRAVECLFPPAADATEIVAPCRVGATDLGLWLLAQGWGEPGDYATDDYRRVAHEARCAGRGLWRGAAPDPSCGDAAQQ
jgi:endonuclease YncB( thermonuclease family)